MVNRLKIEDVIKYSIKEQIQFICTILNLDNIKIIDTKQFIKENLNYAIDTYNELVCEFEADRGY